MKHKILSGTLLVGFVAACSSEPAVTDPYVDLAEGTLLVRFEANPNVAEGECNPNVHYALRTAEEFILLNANYEVVDHNLTGTGTSLINEEGSGVARTTIELSMFDTYPVPCSDLNVRAQELNCRTEDDADNAPCPSPQFEGTDMFASFRELPNY